MFGRTVSADLNIRLDRIFALLPTAAVPDSAKELRILIEQLNKKAEEYREIIFKGVQLERQEALYQAKPIAERLTNLDLNIPAPVDIQLLIAQAIHIFWEVSLALQLTTGHKQDKTRLISLAQKILAMNLAFTNHDINYHLTCALEAIKAHDTDSGFFSHCKTAVETIGSAVDFNTLKVDIAKLASGIVPVIQSIVADINFWYAHVFTLNEVGMAIKLSKGSEQFNADQIKELDVLLQEINSSRFLQSTWQIWYTASQVLYDLVRAKLLDNSYVTTTNPGRPGLFHFAGIGIEEDGGYCYKSHELHNTAYNEHALYLLCCFEHYPPTLIKGDHNTLEISRKWRADLREILFSITDEVLAEKIKKWRDDLYYGNLEGELDPISKLTRKIENRKFVWQEEEFFSGRIVELDSLYVNLSIIPEDVLKKQISKLASSPDDEVYSRFDALYGHERENIRLEHIVHPNSWSEQRILVLGSAGIGKTTMARYIEYLSIKRKLWIQYDLLFKIELRHLLIKEYYPEKDGFTYNGMDIIIQECLEIQQGDFTSLEKEELRNYFIQKKAQRKIIVVLDGIDEIVESFPKHLLFAVRDLLSYPDVILTSRPYYLRHLLDPNFFGFSPSTSVAITGFTDKNRTKYVEKYFSASSHPLPDNDMANKVNSFLNSRPDLRGLCRVPINIKFACNVFSEYDVGERVDTVTKLYWHVIASRCRKYLERRNKEPGIEKVGINVSTLTIFELSEEQLSPLQRIAYTSLQQSMPVFSVEIFIKDSVQRNYPNISKSKRSEKEEQLVNSLLKLGLLSVVDSKASYEANTSFFYPHLSLRDFFAAQYFVKNMTSKKDEVSQYPLYRESQEVNWRQWLSENKFNPSMEIFWWFVAGLLAKHDSFKRTNYVSLFFVEIMTKPNDVLSGVTIPLLTRCLDEASGEKAGKIIFREQHEAIISLIIGCYEIAVELEKKYWLEVDNRFTGRLRISTRVLNDNRLEKWIIEKIKNCDFNVIKNILRFLHEAGTCSEKLIRSMLAVMEKNIKNEEWDAAKTIANWITQKVSVAEDEPSIPSKQLLYSKLIQSWKNNVTGLSEESTLTSQQYASRWWILIYLFSKENDFTVQLKSAFHKWEENSILEKCIFVITIKYWYSLYENFPEDFISTIFKVAVKYKLLHYVPDIWIEKHKNIIFANLALELNDDFYSIPTLITDFSILGEEKEITAQARYLIPIRREAIENKMFKAVLRNGWINGHFNEKKLFDQIQSFSGEDCLLAIEMLNLLLEYNIINASLAVMEILEEKLNSNEAIIRSIVVRVLLLFSTKSEEVLKDRIYMNLVRILETEQDFDVKIFLLFAMEKIRPNGTEPKKIEILLSAPQERSFSNASNKNKRSDVKEVLLLHYIAFYGSYYRAAQDKSDPFLVSLKNLIKLLLSNESIYSLDETRKNREIFKRYFFQNKTKGIIDTVLCWSLFLVEACWDNLVEDNYNSLVKATHLKARNQIGDKELSFHLRDLNISWNTSDPKVVDKLLRGTSTEEILNSYNEVKIEVFLWVLIKRFSTEETPVILKNGRLHYANDSFIVRTDFLQEIRSVFKKITGMNLASIDKQLRLVSEHRRNVAHQNEEIVVSLGQRLTLAYNKFITPTRVSVSQAQQLILRSDIAISAYFDGKLYCEIQGATYLFKIMIDQLDDFEYQVWKKYVEELQSSDLGSMAIEHDRYEGVDVIRFTDNFAKQNAENFISDLDMRWSVEPADISKAKYRIF